MENQNQVIEKLLMIQKKTVDNLDKLNSKFNDLHNALEKSGELFPAEKDLETILKKLEKIDQLAKTIQDINTKIPSLNAMIIQIKSTENKISELNAQFIKMNERLTKMSDQIESKTVKKPTRTTKNRGIIND